MLTDPQLIAIDLMVAGRPLGEVQEAAGISRTQLWRWRTQDPAFALRLEQERARLHQERVDKLWRVTDRAMDVALDSLDEGDPIMARDILRLVAPGLVDVRDATPPAAVAVADPRHALPASETGLRCGVCGKQCRSPGGLASHRRTHTD
jgi:hypothetical protein